MINIKLNIIFLFSLGREDLERQKNAKLSEGSKLSNATLSHNL